MSHKTGKCQIPSARDHSGVTEARVESLPFDCSLSHIIMMICEWSTLTHCCFFKVKEDLHYCSRKDSDLLGYRV